jgi:hypothetical protein
MFYIWLEIHDQRIAICVLSEAGHVARRAQVRTIDEMIGEATWQALRRSPKVYDFFDGSFAAIGYRTWLDRSSFNHPHRYLPAGEKGNRP